MKTDLNDRAEAIQQDPAQLEEGVPMTGTDGGVNASKQHQTGLIRDLIKPAFEIIRKRAEPAGQQEIMWPTWASELRDIYGNGLRPGLHVLVGNTGSGKTQLAVQYARDAVAAGHPTLFLALEADAGGTDVVARLVSLDPATRAMRLHWADLMRGRYKHGNEWMLLEPDRIDAAQQVAERMKDLPITISRPPEATADGIASSIREWAGTGYAGPARLVVVDYLQMVRGTLLNRREAIGVLSGELRRLAADHGLVILCISSTAREKYEQLTAGNTDSTKAPKLGTGDPEWLVGMGKETGEIEYDSDSVMVLCRNKASETTWVAVAKQRIGERSWANVPFVRGFWGSERI
jgi:replicative DNA helicase